MLSDLRILQVNGCHIMQRQVKLILLILHMIFFITHTPQPMLQMLVLQGSDFKVIHLT